MNTAVERMAALARYYGALTHARALAGTRALRDGPTAGELLLEADVAAALGGPLGEMYRRPIEAGLLAMVEQTEAEIRRDVLRFYEERPDVPAGVAGVLRRAARRGFDLGGQMGLSELGLEGQFDLAEPALLDQLDAHVDGLMDTRPGAEMSLAVTTAGEIGREVSRRRSLGETAVDMLPALSAWVLGRTVIRSARIAETETVRMTRWGMVSAFVGNGIRGVRHECEADVDDRCFGKICPPYCGVEYELTGVLDPMGGIPGGAQIPLHPNCILPGNEVVVPGRLSAAAKSFYHGGVIEIVVGDGRILTVTENHPILTPRGWVAAKFLRQGDYVFSATNTQRIAATINPNNDHAPIAIEEVFRALKESPFVVSRVVPHSTVDFHGDGRNIYGDIDVVYIDRLLEGRRVSACGEHLGQLALGGDDLALRPLLSPGHTQLLVVGDGSAAGGVVGSRYLLGASVWSHLRPFEEFGFRTAARLYPEGKQAAANGETTYPQADGNCLFGLAGQVALRNSGRIQWDTELAPVLKDAGLFHQPGDSSLRHALLAREFVNRFSSHITTNEIVGIREFDYAGHVYDLQCDDYELYITEGVITSNCRCWYAPIQDGWLKPVLIWTGFALALLNNEEP